MEVNFGHLEVLHSKFHDPTISNLGDQSGQTNKQTKRQTKRQTDNIYVTGYEPGCTIAGSGLDPRTRAGLLSPAQVLDNLVSPPIPIRCTFIMHDTGRMKYND